MSYLTKGFLYLVQFVTRLIMSTVSGSNIALRGSFPYSMLSKRSTSGALFLTCYWLVVLRRSLAELNYCWCITKLFRKFTACILESARFIVGWRRFSESNFILWYSLYVFYLIVSFWDLCSIDNKTPCIFFAFLNSL